MVMLKGLLILALLVLVGIVDYQAVEAGDPLPSAWFQIGFLSLLIGIAVTRAMVDRLKKASDPDSVPADPPVRKRRIVVSLLLLAGVLFMALYGASLDAAAFGFVVGCLCHATWRITEINESNRKMRGLRPGAMPATIGESSTYGAAADGNEAVLTRTPPPWANQREASVKAQNPDLPGPTDADQGRG